MRRIYLDNGSTSWPKADGVAKAIYDAIEFDNISLNRTESNLAYTAFDRIYTLRETLGRLYNYNRPECIAFTKNVTEALNWIIKGLFSPSDHLIVSSNEHNAVMRPIVQTGIPFSRIPSDSHGFNDYSQIENLIRPETKGIIINAAGNVSGAIQNLEIPAEFARKHKLLFIVDSAQASPFTDIDFSNLEIAAIAFTGHKGFLGPQGTGGMILKREIAETIPPLIAGGTGSESDSEAIPSSLPDRLTPGTENIPGLIGLARAVEYTIGNKEKLKSNMMEKTYRLMEGLRKIDKIDIVGAGQDEKRSNIVSIKSEYIDIAYLSSRILEKSGIETRVGLHCAPSAHKVLGTFPTGSLRLSPGPFTTDDDIDITLETIKEIMNE